MKSEIYFDAITSKEIFELAKIYKSLKWWQWLAHWSIAHALAIKICYRARTRYDRT